MELATPQALGALLKREKEVLLSTWESKARRIDGADQLPSDFFRDHLPHLLDELAAELERPETASQRLLAFSAAHGEHRQKIGLQLPLVVEEYKLLRACIVGQAEAAGLSVTGEANRVMNELIDEGIKAAVRTYIERRGEAERKQRDEFLKFIVHDLRAPLAAIYYAILLVERELQDVDISERVRATHNAIKRNIERMRALIVKLLQEEQNLRTPRSVEVRREPVDLWPIVESAVRALGSLAASSETEVANRVPRNLVVAADAELLERIFQNLLSNAIEYAPKGRVVVGAAPTDHGDVECWVNDNGRGIPPDMQQKVFDKFVTDSKRGTGVGLGLAVVKQLVEAHGGVIDLQSQAGKGTTMRFSIPCSDSRRLGAPPDLAL